MLAKHSNESFLNMYTITYCLTPMLSNRPVGAQVGYARPVVNWIGLSLNMANRQKFRDRALLASAFLLLGINFNMITTAM